MHTENEDYAGGEILRLASLAQDDTSSVPVCRRAMLGATGPLPLKGKARVGDCHRKDRRGLPPSQRPPSVGFADSSPGGGAKDDRSLGEGDKSGRVREGPAVEDLLRGDLIRHFALPVHLAVPEKHFSLTLILVFFDRCGKGALASSATGSARAPFPRARGRQSGRFCHTGKIFWNCLCNLCPKT